jgi:hypothetical protein
MKQRIRVAVLTLLLIGSALIGVRQGMADCAYQFSQGHDAMCYTLDGGVINLFGMELLIQECVESHLANAFHISRTRAEGDPIQKLEGFLVPEWLSCHAFDEQRGVG